MQTITLRLPEDFLEYIDSRTDKDLGINRSDAIRMIISEHREEYLDDLSTDLGWETPEQQEERHTMGIPNPFKVKLVRKIATISLTDDSSIPKEKT